MGEISEPHSVLLFLAAFSRHPEALAWGQGRAVAHWGSIALASDLFDFDATDYYQPTMGPGIKKCFWAFERRIDPGRLAELKIQTNAWEAEYAGMEAQAEPRPLNLDPGYLTPAKLVLASTKDHAHRIYLSRGIFAEVTLFYKDRQWQHRDWTFADYRRADYQRFFDACRQYLRAAERREQRP